MRILRHYRNPPAEAKGAVERLRGAQMADEVDVEVGDDQVAADADQAVGDDELGD